MKINKSDIVTVSNALSFLRLLLVIPVWISLDNYHDEIYRIITFLFCIFAGVTDFLDGYLARKRNEITEVGKIIDPLADKILVAALAVKLFLMGELSTYFLLLIISRDIIIFIGGLVISIKIGKVLPSNLLGKITVTITGFVFLLVIAGINKSHIIFSTVYFASIFLLYASLAAYLIRALEFLKKHRQHEHIN